MIGDGNTIKNTGAGTLKGKRKRLAPSGLPEEKSKPSRLDDKKNTPYRSDGKRPLPLP